MGHIGPVDFQLKINVTNIKSVYSYGTCSTLAVSDSFIVWPSLALIGFRKLAACRVARVYLHSLCGTMIMVQVLRFTFIFIYFVLSGPSFGILL
jgi:hypothetical protein